MTTKGIIGPLKLSRDTAQRVGVLITRLSGGVVLKDTPLELLPAAAAKMLKSARRKGSDAKALVSICTLTRLEAMALYHALAFYFHPDADPRLLSITEQSAVREVVHVLDPLLTAKPGPARMSREDAEYVVDLHHQRDSLSRRNVPPDPAHASRLERRIAKQSALEATPVKRIPLFRQRLSKKNYR